MLQFNKIYNENCLTWMETQDSDIIDLVITSPPYDSVRDYKGYKFDFEAIAKELYRVIKPGGVLVWVVGDMTIKGSESGTSFSQALYFKNECGFDLYDTMIYEKNGAPWPCKNRYTQIFEYMFIMSKGKPKTINLIRDKKNKWGGKTSWGKKTKRQKDGSLVDYSDTGFKKPFAMYGVRNNIWKYNTGHGFSHKDKIAYLHPATFPYLLAEDHIRTWSNENDLIYDCFAGSGTSLIAAKKLNRNYIGTEISKEYCKIIQKRFNYYFPGGNHPYF